MHNNTNSFFLIAGPCVVENKAITFEIAENLKTITTKLNIPFYFKASYKKANRTSIHSFSTIGEDKAIDILKNIKEILNLKIVTDIHETSDIKKIKNIVDVIQIPAFLCRQTELLIAAGETGKIINIKKGQFANATQMQFAREKVLSTGNNKIWITERGNSFGYEDLIVDFRNIPILKSQGNNVVLDITHSLQQPNKENGITHGQPQFAETLAKCGIIAGVDGIFLETHPNPELALSDGKNMLRLDTIEDMLRKLLAIKV
ncbi:MAG: 3-deoxy-8-phosphooctulonate synthase [Sphingobacteriales bacterium]|jgi:2-dehydro-3-deoxyphosphooctonate aldolase (KDO 8-P synthase)|nr:MAG: 3-deoxy-8-phosphooctulonate synthase [Sphingobacteriales bacterium]